MLYLNGNDILKAVTYEEVMDSIEEALLICESGDYNMPQRIHVNDKDNTILYMPCFKNSSFGTKILSIFPENSKIHKPVIEGFMLLNDEKTGLPIALINGAKLTAIRTGGVGGVGIRHSTPRDAKTIGLIGAGVQGFHQMIFACSARNIEKIDVFHMNEEKLLKFIAKLKIELPHVEIKGVNTVEELVYNSEIIVTATTSMEPVLPNNEKILKGKHFIGIGSYKPDMREYPEAAFRLLDKLYIDTEHGLKESGDLITPLNNKWISENKIQSLGNYLNNKSKNKKNIYGTTLFKSVGMALFDLVVAELIYKKAKEKGIGQVISY